MPLHVSSTRAHRQEAKIVLYSLWHHRTETSEWSKITKITKITSYFSNFRPLTCFSVMIPEVVFYDCMYV